MIKYRKPVRRNTPQTLTNTMRDQSGNAIDLSTYVSATLELKLLGQVYTSLSATISSPAGGVVTYSPYAFPLTGVWTAQFYAIDGGSNRVYGEPIEVTVVPNVDDLLLSQLPAY